MYAIRTPGNDNFPDANTYQGEHHRPAARTNALPCPDPSMQVNIAYYTAIEDLYCQTMIGF